MKTTPEPARVCSSPDKTSPVVFCSCPASSPGGLEGGDIERCHDDWAVIGHAFSTTSAFSPNQLQRLSSVVLPCAPESTLPYRAQSTAYMSRLLRDGPIHGQHLF